MAFYTVPSNSTSVPLDLVVSAAAGGVTGLSPTVAIRLGSNQSLYLDWNDNTFKPVGWTTKYAAMTEVERGHYSKVLNLSTIGAAEGESYVVQYTASGYGESNDVIFCSSPSASADITLLRKALTNKMTEAPGATGKLRLYDDDGVTVIATWDLHDYTGGAITGNSGVPAQRGAKT